MQTRSELTLIRSFLDSDRRSIVIAIFASIVSGASSALLIAFIGKQFVRTEPFGMQSIALFAVLLILSVATNLYASKVLIEASSEHSYSLRMALCRRIVSTGYERIEKIGSPRLIAMLSEDLTDVAVAFTRIPVLVTNSTRVFFCIVYLLWMTPLAMTLLLLLSLPVIYFQILLYRRAKVHLQVLLPIRDRRYSLYVMLTSGIKELLVDRLTRVGFFTNQLEENARKFKFAQQKSFMANQYAANWGQSSYFVVIFGLLIVASHGFVSQEVVAAITLVGLFIRSSLNTLLQAVPQWMKASVAVDKMNSLDLSGESAGLFAEKVEDGIEGSTESVSLSMVDVEYSYAREFAPEVPTKGSKEGPTVGPLSLDFSSGEVVFITGGNGSGKTTLVKLLASLYKPSAGYITLNGKRLGEESEEWYRQHFYAIFSEFCLIDELFRSLQSKSEAVMSSYLDKLRLPTKLMNSSGDVMFKELSSGQQARLALLPVYMIDKPVLIFDEWAAHQDPEFKRLFYHQLLPELKRRNKLIIVITHDDRYFETADRILRLDSGRVVEDFLNINPLVGNSSQRL